MFTVEDTLTTDLVHYWTAHPPAGLEGWNIYDAYRNPPEIRTFPYIVIGSEGFERQKQKGMENTGRVALRIMPVSDMDVTPADAHRAAAGAIEAALLALPLKPGPLALTYLYAFLRDSPRRGLADSRREYTELRYTAVVTRMREI